MCKIETCLQILVEAADSFPRRPSGGPLPPPNHRPNVSVDRKEVDCCLLPFVFGRFVSLFVGVLGIGYPKIAFFWKSNLTSKETINLVASRIIKRPRHSGFRISMVNCCI
jgi:hypothetical protein